eukprot:75824-Prymnesium_polylepis.1
MVGGFGQGGGFQGRDVESKFFLPEHAGQCHNMIGLVIGPRGNTQQRLQRETGCQIIVRGRGTSKQGQEPEDEEALHVLIRGPSEEAVNKARDAISTLIDFTSAEGDELRQKQWRELK